MTIPHSEAKSTYRLTIVVTATPDNLDLINHVAKNACAMPWQKSRIIKLSKDKLINIVSSRETDKQTKP